MEKQKRDVLKICFVLFAVFFSVAFLFPYTGDDWTWGSDAGLAYLKSFFHDYNGRYLGNLLVLVLTRSKVLDAAVMAVSYVLICLFCYEYSEEKSRVLIWTAAILFFLMPKDIWAQTIVWTSGFSNYVPSALITAVFLFSARKTADTNFPSSEKFFGKMVWMFLLGFAGALFVENITVFHIGFALLVIIYTFLRFRRYDGSHLSFFLGAVLGACFMFSNSAYHKIAMGDDYYRTTPQSMGEIIETIMEHAGDILTYIIYDNLLFCGIVTILLVILGELRKQSEGKQGSKGQIAVTLHLGCFLLVLCKDTVLCLLGQLTALSWRRELLIGMILALLYVFSIFLVILSCVEKWRGIRMLLPLCCAAGAMIPLLVVNPIGPRCVFVGYFFMMVFTVNLAGYLRAKAVPEEKWLSKLGCLIVLLQAFVFLNIFYPVYCCETFRTDFIKRQAKTGAQSIYTCELPNSDYLWNSNPTGTSLPKRYRLFHNLDENTEFVFIPVDELKALSEAYK